MELGGVRCAEHFVLWWPGHFWAAAFRRVWISVQLPPPHSGDFWCSSSTLSSSLHFYRQHNRHSFGGSDLLKGAGNHSVVLDSTNGSCIRAGKMIRSASAVRGARASTSNLIVRADGDGWPPAWLLPSIKQFSTASVLWSSKGAERYAFPSKANPTPYEIFHFPKRGVTSAEVKLRYYDLVRTLHPDRYNSDQGKTKSQVEEEFKQVVQAYNILKDSKKKHLYDRAGLGWTQTSPSIPPWQDRRYTRRYSPGYRGEGHDRFGWQNHDFYSNFTRPSASAAGWNGGNGKITNGYFISAIFVLTWVLAGLQYSRLSLQSQKAIERADKHHLDAAKSLHEARQIARSDEGKQRWFAIRQRAREQKFLQDKDSQDDAGAYGVGHGGPSGKQAAQERFQKALPPPAIP